MRAMVLSQQAPVESSPLQLVELPDPVPGPGEVLLRVTACGRVPRGLRVKLRRAPPLFFTPGRRKIKIGKRHESVT